MQKLITEKEFIELTKKREPFFQTLKGSGTMTANGVIPSKTTIYIINHYTEEETYIYINKEYLTGILKDIEKFDPNYFHELIYNYLN